MLVPLTLSTGASLVKSADFQERVAMAFYFVARQVLAEDVGITGHEQRANFAMSITRQQLSDFQRYAAMVATQGAIVDGGPYATAGVVDQSKVTDARILDAVTGMWNWLANVPAPQPPK